MISKLLTFGFLVLVALLSVHQSEANIIGGRLRPIIRVTPYPIPSFVDTTTWNFTKPSDFASLCLKNQLGKNIVDFCQSKAQTDYDPYKMKDTKTETWEVCCSLFDEVSCYANNARDFCEPSLATAVVKYSSKVGSFFSYNICRSTPYYSWKRSCNNETHAHEVAETNKTANNNPNYKPSFINIPTPTGPELSCFRKLRLTYKNSSKINGKQYNAETGCLQKSLNVWDPARRKLKTSKVFESCCGTYQALDCVLEAAKDICSAGKQQTDMANYGKSSQVMLESTICKAVPAAKREAICKGAIQKGSKGAAFSATPSAFLALILAIFFFLSRN